MKRFKYVFFTGWLLSIPLIIFSGDTNQYREIDDIAHQKNKMTGLMKPASFADEAIGVMKSTFGPREAGMAFAVFDIPTEVQGAPVKSGRLRVNQGRFLPGEE